MASDKNAALNIKPLDLSSEKFRIQNQKFYITYYSHIQKEFLIKNISEKIVSQTKENPKFIRVAHIKSNEGDDQIKQTIVLVDCGKAFQSKFSGIFTFSEFTPLICIINDSKTFTKLIEMLTEDPENKDLVVKKLSFAEIVWQSSSLADALTRCDKKDFNAVKIAWESKRKAPPSDNMHFEWRIFQKRIYDLVRPEVKPDGRSINWFWETKGKVGKTQLAKKLKMKHPGYFELVDVVGPHKDFATVIDGFFQGGWNGHCLMINLTRTNDKSISMYQCLEAMADGLITAIKYKGQSMIWSGCHVVIFANWTPTENRSSDGTKILSGDRMRVHEITKDEVKKFTKKTPPEIPDGYFEMEEQEPEEEEEEVSEEDYYYDTDDPEEIENIKKRRSEIKFIKDSQKETTIIKNEEILESGRKDLFCYKGVVYKKGISYKKSKSPVAEASVFGNLTNI